MSPEEFKALLAGNDDAEVVRHCLDGGEVPYVFNGDDTAWRQFQGGTAVAVGARPEDVRVVGSGRFGFSLKPASELRPFQDTSDVDVVVVSADTFDRVWLQVLEVAYPRPPTASTAAQSERQKSVYTGWLSFDTLRFDVRMDGEKVRPLLDFKTAWFNSFKSASRSIPIKHEDVSARLYRSWEHVRLYHMDSIRALRRSLGG